MKTWIGIILIMGLLMGCAARVLPESEQLTSNASAVSQVSSKTGEISENPVEVSEASSENLPETPTEPKGEDWALLLANFDHPVGDYTPELAEVQNGYQMDVRVADGAKQMIADAKSQGVELLVCSAYRPYSSQERNFNNSVEQYIAQGLTREKAVEETAKLIAEPGKSEHQTGLAADIVTPSFQNLVDAYETTDAAKWLAKNAPDYGFILRFPKDKTQVTRISYEPWHFRYVGVDAAREITAAGLCLEEYLGVA